MKNFLKQFPIESDLVRLLLGATIAIPVVVFISKIEPNIAPPVAGAVIMLGTWGIFKPQDKER